MRKRDARGHSYPVVVVNREEHEMDMQEMLVCTALCWNICDFAELARKYDSLAEGTPAPRRTLEFRVERLQTRGLVAAGYGDADFDAVTMAVANPYLRKQIVLERV